MTGDPDLDQACDDFRFAAKRLRQLQAFAADREQPYRTLTARTTELADATEEFAVRGEKLRLHADRRLAGRALLLVVEEVDRLRTKFKRRPTGIQLREALALAHDNAARDRLEAEAEITAAQLVSKNATHRVAAGAAALSYLEACHGA